MLAQKMSSCAIKADQYASEGVDPSESTFAGKAQTIDFGIKQAFASTLGLAAVAGIGADVGTQSKLEADMPCSLGVKGGVRVETRVTQGRSRAAQVEDGALQMRCQPVGIMLLPAATSAEATMQP